MAKNRKDKDKVMACATWWKSNQAIVHGDRSERNFLVIQQIAVPSIFLLKEQYETTGSI